ncbi:TPA: hypothetical protein ACHHOD_001516 [Staphylococcus aureus]|uniref:hypothetical protein n=1 Tax=Staphylococcus aureus TaxID=1280 RepID=UPI0018D639C3|nr:hypothetical protein [Staphylococcus aureus]MBH4590385.1 hypothetical protein [Staphylococcus aureus]MBH4592731.1 hypothetical protein [Staphylococcus aureus]MBH4595638.1 hypothetical protein [Staphylococcus aureus]MBH4598307.1 hypothetical protein [Staphylococcus aureus]
MDKVITFLIIIFLTILIVLYYFNAIKKNYEFANSAQKIFSIISFTFATEVYLLFAIYILFFKIFNSKNIEITVFIVSLTTVLFQQFLPKSFERVVLSDDNTKLKLDKKYGEKMAIDFKIFNYVGMIIILSMLIIKFAHLVLKGILNY